MADLSAHVHGKRFGRSQIMASQYAWMTDWGGTERYPLTVIYPLPSGIAGTGVDPTNRCLFAYTGLDYDIQVAAVGGVYPYLYELSNEPAGMTVDAFTGVITWTNPQTTATDVTVRVTDTKGSQSTATWSISVGTSGWYFVDAVNGNAHSTNGGSGTGTLANPWLTLDDVYDGSSAGSRVYFRTGTYTPLGLPSSSVDDINGEERVDWNDNTRSTIWLAYPNESPVIDYGYVGTGYPYNTGDSVPRFRLSGDAVYLDGFTTTRSMTMAFQLGRGSRYGVHIRRVTMGTHGPGINGGNSAHLMWMQMYASGESHDTPAFGDVIHSCSFSGIDDSTATNAGNCALKLYSWMRGLIADSDFSDIDTGPEDEAAIAIKSNVSQVEVRGCTFSSDMTTICIGGNMHNALDDEFEDEQTFGQIRFCNVKGGASHGLTIGHQSGPDFGPWYVERNTFQCSVLVDELDSTDSQIIFERNVIVNADGSGTPWRFIQDGPGNTDTSKVTLNISSNPELSPTGVENLAGASSDAITDADGELQGAYRTAFLGTHGHEISGAP